MGWTKRQYIEQAFEEIGLGSYSYDLLPEQIISAARRLDAMVAEWIAGGISLGWPFSSTPDGGDIDTPVPVPTAANGAIYLNLAVRLAPSFGKLVPPELASSSRVSLSSLLASCMSGTIERKFPVGMPLGQGNKSQREHPFTQPSTETLIQPEDDGFLEP